MNIISAILQKKRDNSTCALIPFLTAGYPSLDLTVEALLVLNRRGADVIELGIPYSDSLADGPLIQNASKVALKQGVYIDQVLSILKTIQTKIDVPIVIFTYYNPILVRGLRRFIQEISNCGAKGLVIPDLPIEETDYISVLCKNYQLELILFISPTSSVSRISHILSKAPGCVYLVSSTGVTGIRDSISYKISFISNYVSSNTDKNIMLGFGISSPSQVSNVLRSQFEVDGIVVGSAFTRLISQSCDSEYLNLGEDLGDFCEQMKQAMFK
uniref:Tryptophan synthase alpha chain n=1 Tax=Pleurostichidium falkenbergii TaxID=121064 RepID=A0A4D6UX90_9FLOR|nr:Tryptophan synthase alpha subunit [Pleurostichidium falkenbergii]QCH39605.1 Tryptophan synthase alpha subunit [Pleurostichidium falkenbergii]